MSEEQLCCLKSGPVFGLFAQVAAVLHREILSFRPPQRCGDSDSFPLAAHKDDQGKMLWNPRGAGKRREEDFLALLLYLYFAPFCKCICLLIGREEPWVSVQNSLSSLNVLI